MRKWELYTYEIAIAAVNGKWDRTILRDCASRRSPDQFARSILEGWIIDNRSTLPGGQVFVRSDNLEGDPDDVVASVRVRVWRGGRDHRSPKPVAAAYLGYRNRDVPAWVGRWIPRPRRNSHDDDLIDDDGTGSYTEPVVIRRRRRAAA